jgi:transcription elongation factor GreA
MTEKETILTAEGLKKLEEKLETLKSVRRLEVAERIKQAISFGDISENSEYEDAKNEQAFIEGEIITLDKMIRTAKVIDGDEIKTDVVNLGATVKLRDMAMKSTVEYTLVGSAEADPLDSKISNESPVGSAIIGKKAGETVEVTVPDGVIKYKIMSIKRT